MRLNENTINEIRSLKESGTANLQLMTRYNITYAELREILDNKQ